jgi:hypothetical protein
VGTADSAADFITPEPKAVADPPAHAAGASAIAATAAQANSRVLLVLQSIKFSREVGMAVP